MKRRNFIKFSVLTTLFLTTPIIARVFSKDDTKVLYELFEIIFPKTSIMPSASEFKAVEYLVTNISHKTFDDEDKKFLTQAINDFSNSFPQFLSLNSIEKKELIFSVIKTNDYARSFISKLSYYGIEAMFSDPIYGGNYNQIVWNSVNHHYGEPRPKRKYGQKYEL